MRLKLRFTHLLRCPGCAHGGRKSGRLTSVMPTSILAVLAVMIGVLIHAAPVAAGEGDRAVIVVIPMSWMDPGSQDYIIGPSISLGYEHDPGGGYAAELFGALLSGTKDEGLEYGVNLSLIAPHGPHPLMRGRIIVGMTYYDPSWSSVWEPDHGSLGWQAGVRWELGRHVFVPLVLEVLYRSLKVSGNSGADSFTRDFSGPVFNFGFGFRFP